MLVSQQPNLIATRWVQEGFWLEIEHDGRITWDAMQAIKNQYFGVEATCYEVFPPQSKLVNNGNFRHLWLAPDITAFQ